MGIWLSKYLLILAGIFACSPSMHFNPGYSTPELRTQISNFEIDFHTQVKFDVLFVNELSQGALSGASGYCFKSEDFRRVEIRSIFDNPDSLYFNSVLYHELGHCALNLSHYESTIDIMNALIVITTKTFKQYQLIMIDNYFNGVYE